MDNGIFNMRLVNISTFCASLYVGTTIDILLHRIVLEIIYDVHHFSFNYICYNKERNSYILPFKYSWAHFLPPSPFRPENCHLQLLFHDLYARKSSQFLE